MWDMLEGHAWSTKAGATTQLCSLPVPGTKPRHLGTEKGHFENTTHKGFNSGSIDTADFPSTMVPKITSLLP